MGVCLPGRHDDTFGLFDMHGNAEEMTRGEPFLVARGGVGAATSA